MIIVIKNRTKFDENNASGITADNLENLNKENKKKTTINLPRIAGNYW